MINYLAPDLAAIEQQIADLDAQIASPTPTPPVGTSVIWYERADARTGGEIASIVTKVEGPGKVTLTVFRPFSMPHHKRGCLHITNPIHEMRHNSVSVNSGAWDYVPGQPVPKSHYELHVKDLTGRRDALKDQLAEAKVIVANESAKAEAAKPAKAASK